MKGCEVSIQNIYACYCSIQNFSFHCFHCYSIHRPETYQFANNNPAIQIKQPSLNSLYSQQLRICFPEQKKGKRDQVCMFANRGARPHWHDSEFPNVYDIFVIANLFLQFMLYRLYTLWRSVLLPSLGKDKGKYDIVAIHFFLHILCCKLISVNLWTVLFLWNCINQ